VEIYITRRWRVAWVACSAGRGWTASRDDGRCTRYAEHVARQGVDHEIDRCVVTLAEWPPGWLVTQRSLTRWTRAVHQPKYTLYIPGSLSLSLSHPLCYLRNVYIRFYRTTLCVRAVFAVVRCLSVCHVSALYPDGWKNMVIAPSLLFFYSQRQYPIPRGTPSAGRKIHGGGKILWFGEFSAEIALYLGNGTTFALGCYGTLIGSRRKLVGGGSICIGLSRTVSEIHGIRWKLPIFPTPVY